ncbi:beta-L-arabinofuranosidase domain-containing protein [Streptomyces sp. NBC_00151]|uniref:beta-L-arabinofuranosidase domain-containing protein n=1 Tax=Streptomyces sp. NBC_00151 TaxID=2975669 RepID=UPI002DD81116|nr:RICIN domain-containing protein [Streptomyces sp. NBC_00151]WRZ44096.1 glycoside hydrolase family 127 protein [Streptomyces sp. NBC_00151]
MSVSRRRILAMGSGALGAAALGGTFAGPAAAVPQPRAETTPADAFQKLPPGSVAARGWLAGQLRLQLAGLCGTYENFSHFLDFSTTGWTHPEHDAWEEVPYWLRGYIPLAIATGDPHALTRSREWVDAILATQQSDGFFGPRGLRTALNGGPDFWPFLPLLQALRTHEEYTHDQRIVPFLVRFLRYMNAQGPGAFNASWVSYRWGDGLDIVVWLHRRTGEAFLLDLAAKMHSYGVDWTGATPSRHNVNIAQGFREPAQYGRLTGSADLTRATYQAYDAVMGAYGRFPGGGLAGDENYRPGFADPRQGFETCGIVEFMASHELLTRITGDPVWADRCEDLAFNMLPASLDPDGKSVHYITSANSVDLDNRPKTQGQFQNGFAMQAFQAGVDQYRCCPHNYGMGWPYFTEELWLASADGGLVAALYAPSRVRATVTGGTTVTVTEETGYPFQDTITLTVSTPRPVRFPLQLRVPGWCTGPQLQVNGTAVTSSDGPSWARIDRTWRDGDVVRLRLPQKAQLRSWPGQHGAVSVERGPLTYSLKIGERYDRYAGDDRFPAYEVHATTGWNYGLLPETSLTPAQTGTAVPDQPFTPGTTPVSIAAQARRIQEWVADDEHVVAPLQDSPARSDAPVETVTLIPMGAARLRVTSFPTAAPDGRPWTPEPPFRRLANKNSGKVLAVDGMSTENSARVVQFDNTGTGDHAWQLIERGDGWHLIRNGNSGKVLGVDHMSMDNSAIVVQFEDNGTDDHLWALVDNGDGWYRIRNKNSGKVLGVDRMSTGNSAQVVQYDDNGTADHLWRFL